METKNVFIWFGIFIFLAGFCMYLGMFHKTFLDQNILIRILLVFGVIVCGFYSIYLMAKTAENT